jgi:DNA-binding MarR family transcriptional regulator
MTRLDLPGFLPFRLNQLAAEVSGRLSTIYAERFDLDVPQWRVLAALADGQVLTAQDIVASTRTHKSTVSRAVQSLLERGLIAAAPNASDGRSRTLCMTDAGRLLMAELIPLAKKFEDDLLSELSGPSRESLLVVVADLERVLHIDTARAA